VTKLFVFHEVRLFEAVPEFGPVCFKSTGLVLTNELLLWLAQ